MYVLWFVNLFQDDRHLQDSVHFQRNHGQPNLDPTTNSKELKAAAACEFSGGSPRPHRHPESPTGHSTNSPSSMFLRYYWHFYILIYWVRAFLLYVLRTICSMGLPFQPKLPLDLRSLVISLTNTYVHQKVRLHEATKSKHIHDIWKDTLSPLHYEGLIIFPDFEK